MKCPICKKEADPSGEYYPFCSERCKIIDLGNWASEKYVIPAPLEPGEESTNDEPPYADEPETEPRP